MSGDKVKIVYIKKKGKEAGHHGGAWKVAYADFVTAMMALFIVLWLLTQTDAPSKERIAQYFRTGILPGGSLVHGKTQGSNPAMAINIFPSAPPPRYQAGGSPDGKSLTKLTTDVKTMLGVIAKDKQLEALSDHATAKIVDEGALIELVDGGDSFLFSLASSDLKPGAVAFLKHLAPLLAALPNKVEIHGHTDARRFDKQASQDNWDLSFERANQAREVLEANGLPKGRVSAVLAHADSSPYNEKDPFGPENRRLSILVVRAGHEAERQGKLPPRAGPAAPIPKAAEAPGAIEKPPPADNPAPAEQPAPADKTAPAEKPVPAEQPAPSPSGEPKGAEPPAGKLAPEKTTVEPASPANAAEHSPSVKSAAKPQTLKRPAVHKRSKKPVQP